MLIESSSIIACLDVWWNKHNLFLFTITLKQESATYSPRARSGPPSKIFRAAAPLPNCSHCMALLMVLYLLNLRSF